MKKNSMRNRLRRLGDKKPILVKDIGITDSSFYWFKERKLFESKINKGKTDLEEILNRFQKDKDLEQNERINENRFNSPFDRVMWKMKKEKDEEKSIGFANTITSGFSNTPSLNINQREKVKRTSKKFFSTIRSKSGANFNEGFTGRKDMRSMNISPRDRLENKNSNRLSIPQKMTHIIRRNNKSINISNFKQPYIITKIEESDSSSDDSQNQNSMALKTFSSDYQNKLNTFKYPKTSFNSFLTEIKNTRVKVSSKNRKQIKLRSNCNSPNPMNFLIPQSQKHQLHENIKRNLNKIRNDCIQETLTEEGKSAINSYLLETLK